MLKKLSRFLLAALIMLCCITYAEAQNKAEYKIAAYERNTRIVFTSEDRQPKYEVRSLFIKTDTGWIKNEDSLPTKYVKVFKGNRYEKIAANKCKLIASYDTASNYTGLVKNYGFFTANPVITLTDGYFSKQFKSDEAETIKRASLLSNNPAFKQHTKLKKYIVTTTEKKMLLDSAKVYLEKLYRSNERCVEQYNPHPDSANWLNLIDTVIKYELLKNELFIDSANSFVDQHGNKLINVLYPTDFHLNFIYPFNGECFREDNGYHYFSIMCYLDSSGKISFLHDELQYLDHGDFDIDGKDEYLFWYAIHNHAGYIMYYDNFQKMVKNTWSYH